jgi:capsular polysaccharide biosynthesis protein
VSTYASNDRLTGEYPDLRAVVDVARRGWWVIVLLAILFASLASTLASRGTAQYEATAHVLVGPLSGQPADIRAAGQRAPTYAALATSERVVAAAAARVGEREPATRLAGSVTAEADASSRLVTITADRPSARGAANLVNAIAAQLGPAIFRDPRAAAAEFHLVDPATPPGGSVGTHARPLMIFAAIAGALVALTLLLVRDYFRGRLTRAQDLVELADAPLLAVLDPAKPGGGYDVLAARIALAARRIAVRSILVAGDAAEDVAGQLADAMEASGTPVVRVTAPTAPAEARRALRRKFDPRILVVAAPAPDRFPAAVACTRFVDSTILVAREGQTSRDAVAEWAAALRQVGGTLLGTAMYTKPGRLRPLAARLRGTGASSPHPHPAASAPETA